MNIHKKNIQLSTLLEEQGKEDYHLVTRPTGKSVRRALEDRFEQVLEPTLFCLSFQDIGIVDFSCADEVFAKLGGRMRQGEYENVFMVLDDLRSSHVENISVALREKQLCLIGRQQGSNEWEELGKVDQYLQEVLDLLTERGAITAKELSETLDLEHNTASTRLGNLHNIRMVVRSRETVEEGGRMYVYRPVPHIMNGS